MPTQTRTAWLTPRSVPFSDEEKQSARNALSKLNEFLAQLWATIQHSERVMDQLKDPNMPSGQLFQIRHLIRRFRDEVRQHFAKLIQNFGSCVESLNPFSKDVETNRMKDHLLDDMSQLSQFVELFLETLEDFNSPDQIKRLNDVFLKIKQLAQSIEIVIKGRLRDHFEKNILNRQKVGTIEELRGAIRRRARLIAMLE